MIEIKDIEKLSQLARLHLEDDEKAGLAKEIESILAYVDQIKGASATAQASTDYQRNVLRDDANPHQSGTFTEVLLKAAPATQGEYFKVKKILN